MISLAQGEGGLAREPLQTITYEAIPSYLCYSCVAVKIVASSDGAVLITRHLVGIGAKGKVDPPPQREVVSLARFAHFASALAHWRPLGVDKHLSELGEGCAPVWTDQDRLTITWDGNGDSQDRHDSLPVYFGCDPDRWRSTFEALRLAPDALGLGDLGTH